MIAIVLRGGPSMTAAVSWIIANVVLMFVANRLFPALLLGVADTATQEFVNNVACCLTALMATAAVLMKHLLTATPHKQEEYSRTEQLPCEKGSCPYQSAIDSMLYPGQLHAGSGRVVNSSGPDDCVAYCSHRALVHQTVTRIAERTYFEIPIR